MRHRLFIFLLLCQSLLTAAPSPSQPASILLLPVHTGSGPLLLDGSEEASSIPQLDQIFKGQLYRAYFTVPNSLEPSLLKRLRYDLTILNPMDQTYFEALKQPFQKGETHPIGSRFRTSDVATLMHEADDLLGVYTFRLHVYDPQGSWSSEVSASLELKAFRLQAGFSDTEYYEDWLHAYYLKPKPDEAIIALLHLAEFDFEATDPLSRSQLLIEASFFMSVLEHNPWILPYLRILYANAGTEQQKRLLLLLGLAYPDEDLFDEEQLGPDERYFYDWARSIEFPDPTELIESPTEIDLAWARFFATGHREAVRSIARALVHKPQLEAVQDDLQMMGGAHSQQQATFEAARWSLLDNARHHPLVRAYLSELTEDTNLPESCRLEVEALLADLNRP